MMHVLDVFDVGMRLDGHRIETAKLAHLHERRRQRGERLHGRSRPHVLVLGQNGQPVDVFHRHHRAIEAALVPGRGRALLALHRIGIDVVAGKSVFGRDQVGGNALRHEIVRDRDRRIDRPGAARSPDADPAHGFDAAADRHVLLPGHDLGRGEIHRVEAGSAEAVDLYAGDAVAIARHQRRGARDIGGGLAHRIDHAEHHVIDQRGIEIVAALDGAERLGRQIERGHFVQRAVRLAAAARRAHVVINKGVGHQKSSQSRRRSVQSYRVGLGKG